MSLWVSRRPFDVAVAVAVCAGCRVRGECLADVLELEADGYRFGVRGGLTAKNAGKLLPPIRCPWRVDGRATPADYCYPSLSAATQTGFRVPI